MQRKEISSHWFYTTVHPLNLGFSESNLTESRLAETAFVLFFRRSNNHLVLLFWLHSRPDVTSRPPSCSSSTVCFSCRLPQSQSLHRNHWKSPYTPSANRPHLSQRLLFSGTLLIPVLAERRVVNTRQTHPAYRICFLAWLWVYLELQLFIRRCPSLFSTKCNFQCQNVVSGVDI